jgi:hypothetical protein
VQRPSGILFVLRADDVGEVHDALDAMGFDGMQEILQHGRVTAYDGDALGNILNGLPVGLGIKEHDPFASV